MFLTQDQLLDRLDLHLTTADRVDIAVAWASPGRAFSKLLSFTKAKPDGLRAIVGISGNSTHPQALRDLNKYASLKIPDSNPLFHPKLFIFYQGDKATVWIGSANLSRPGFEQNTELVSEGRDDGSAATWFDKLWKGLDGDPSEKIKEYAREWKPAGSFPRNPVGSEKPPSERAFQNLAQGISDWGSFVEALTTANRYWGPRIGFSVDGEFSSWLNTITLGHAIVVRDNWAELSKDDYRLLMGLDTSVDDVGSGYGLLGSMRGAGNAKNIFNRDSKTNLAVREKIRRALQPALRASLADFPAAAANFIRSVEHIGGFSGAIATRLLALARPDLAVSVNRGSRDGLAALSGLPPTSLNKAPTGPRARSYVDLVHFLAQQPWYVNPTPANAYETALANSRAALLDCLVYRPVAGAEKH
jgi:HKD family nuclease